MFVGLEEFDLAAVLCGDPLGDGKTQARAGAELGRVIARTRFVGAVESFEDMRLGLGWYALAGVLDDDLMMRILSRERDPYLPIGGRVLDRGGEQSLHR